MNRIAQKKFEELMLRYPSLAVCREQMLGAFLRLKQTFDSGGVLLICGNGGSAADAEHIAGELMKGFLSDRPLDQGSCRKLKEAFPEDLDYFKSHLQRALPAIPLVGHSALFTAFVNDVAADMVFAQQVYGYFRPQNAVLGISTSGSSRNVVNAMKIAKALGNRTIALTGQSGGLLKKLCDVAICVPETETFRIQELHLPVYHALCAMLEADYFPDESGENTP